MQVADRLGDGFGLGDDGGFQRRAVRRRRVRPVEPANRRVQVVEALIGELRGDLGADAERGERLVDDQQPPRLGDRPEDRFDVQRRHGARIDQLDRDPLSSRAFADLQGVMHHQGQRDDRDVAPFANDRRLAKRISYRSSGTGPLMPRISRCSRKMTGSSQCRACVSSPLAS